MGVFDVLFEQENESNKSVFLRLREGQLTFRIVSDPVLEFRRWVVQDPETNRWIPAIGYNPSDRRVRRPVTVEVWRGKARLGDHKNDPIVKAIRSMPLPEGVKEEATRVNVVTLFSIIDLSRVARTPDGLVYPSADGKFPERYLDSVEIRDEPAVLILPGMPRYKKGMIVGDKAVDKLYQTFIDLAETDPATSTLTFNPSDFIFTMKVVRDVNRWKVAVNARRATTPIEKPFYDLEYWPVPVEYVDIERLLAGEITYDELLARSGTAQTPQLRDPDADLF